MQPVDEPAGPRPLEPGAYHELRVHGVAGSPPESILGLQAQLAGIDVRRPVIDCGIAAEPGDVSVWYPPDVEPQLRAWSWGSLTSGRWYQAFYLLLLPFMIANVAGWMLVGRRDPTPDEPRVTRCSEEESGVLDAEFRDGHLRVSAFLVRVVGLLVTVVFVLSFQLVLADLVVWQWLYRGLGWPLWTVGLGPAATAAVLVGAVVLARIRQRPQAKQRPWDDHRDPVGLGFLQRRQVLLWNSPGINVALRRLHLTAGLGTIALLAAWPAGELDGTWPVVRRFAFGLAVAALLLVVGLLGRISLGDGTSGMGRVLPVVRYGTWPVGAAAVGLASLVPIGLSPATAASWVTLPALRGAPLWVAAGVLVGVLVLAGIGWRTRPRRRVANAPSLLLLAASVGAAFGAGLTSQTARLVGGDCGPGRTCLVVGEQVEWLAIGVTTSLAVLVAVSAVRWAVLAGIHRDGRVAAHHLTTRATWVTALLGSCGAVLAVAGVGIGLLRPGGLPAVDRFPAGVAALVVGFVVGPVVVGALFVAWTAPAAARRRAGSAPDGRTQLLRVLGLLAVAAVVGLILLAVRNGWTVTVLGIPLPPTTFAEFALDAAILLPTAALLTRIYGGLTGLGVRRRVGVLWDVGTFWPRWFHPLAPPTYSDRAVRQLIAQLDADLEVADHRMLLAPHSQGAVIAAVAVLAGPVRPGLAMLSCGSPWSHLYAEFFPTHVNADSTAAVAARLRDPAVLRWRNLHRETDPIGGPIVGVDDLQPLLDPCRRGHVDYWAEPAYRASVATLRRALGDPVSASPARGGSGFGGSG